ncbi:hypothetical protein PCASD_06993 [Puccinia coronata f. sp. avenae]|uniref:Uncharacterized protein n=1 Tax=Puccinia coronata f. sp. avenae TaxID=200324 RepID=A0A2N5UZZ3_9BASI|nr:hypothetical protein PCASD_16969 [Puccinia coronata f. sp. avenae]PLW43226.1 hypothetical protein PCASD_06993 [Puccinia coronata f. sp. avenae]
MSSVVGCSPLGCLRLFAYMNQKKRRMKTLWSSKLKLPPNQAKFKTSPWAFLMAYSPGGLRAVICVYSNASGSKTGCDEESKKASRTLETFNSDDKGTFSRSLAGKGKACFTVWAERQQVGAQAISVCRSTVESKPSLAICKDRARSP